MKTTPRALLAAAFAALCAATAPAPALAQTPADPAAAAEMSDAEVRKIDKAQGKVTLKHGPIKSLDMPPMTMVFTVRDKALLDIVKTGDQVRFRAVNENGRITVIEMTPAK